LQIRRKIKYLLFEEMENTAIFLGMSTFGPLLGRKMDPLRWIICHLGRKERAPLTDGRESERCSYWGRVSQPTSATGRLEARLAAAAMADVA